MFKYIVYKGNNSKQLIAPALEARGNWSEATEKEAQQLRAHFIWTPVALSISTYAKLDPTIHNHLENIRSITTKPGLVRSLRKYYSQIENYSIQMSMPTSYIIKADLQELEFRQFAIHYKELRIKSFSKEKMPSKHCEENMWLIKPAALNQGRGITVCRNWEQIQKVLLSKTPDAVWLVQKYIERPLLFKGRKLDIRIWAVMTAKHDLFYYRKGYLRTSSSAYHTSAEDNFIHLTNNCLQKNGEDYGLHEAGNTLSFEAFQEYLDGEWGMVNVWTDLVPRMKDLMVDVFVSSTNYLQIGKKELVFELVGFDFLVDEDFRVWLIEANTNPYLGVPNEYIEEIMPKMIDDLLSITVDPYLQPQTPRDIRDNDFELLVSLGRSVFSKKNVNARRPFSCVYPFPELVFAQKLAEEKNKEPVRLLKKLVRGFLEIKGDLKAASSTLINHIYAWEDMPLDHLRSSVSALRIIANHSVPIGSEILELIKAVPDYIKKGILDNIFRGKTAMKLELLRSGVIQWAILQIFESSSMKHFCIEVLFSLIKDKEIPRERLSVVFLTLFISGEESKSIRDRLTEVLKLKDWSLQLEVIDGHATELSLPALDPDFLAQMRVEIAEMVGKLSPEKHIPISRRLKSVNKRRSMRMESRQNERKSTSPMKNRKGELARNGIVCSLRRPRHTTKKNEEPKQKQIRRILTKGEDSLCKRRSLSSLHMNQLKQTQLGKSCMTQRTLFTRRAKSPFSKTCEAE